MFDHHVTGFLEDCHPLVDKIALGLSLIHISQQSLDAATTAVAQDQYIFYPKPVDGKLECGAGSVKFMSFCVWRDQVGDISKDK